MIRSPEIPISFSLEPKRAVLITSVMCSDRYSIQLQKNLLLYLYFHVLRMKNILPFIWKFAIIEPQAKSLILSNFLKVIMDGKGTLVSFTKYSE